MRDIGIALSTFILIIFGSVVLDSLTPHIFPNYFVYIFVASLAFLFFSNIDFDVTALFSKYFYGISVFLLVLTLIWPIYSI